MLALAFVISSTISAGVGDIAGGNNKHFKAFLNDRYFYIDWPVIKYTNTTHYKIHELCIHDINFFATKKLFPDGSRRLMKRIYADQNCIVTNDPMCDRVHQYVDQDVDVNIYLKDREGIDRSYDIKGRIHDQFLVTSLLYEIPECSDL